MSVSFGSGDYTVYNNTYKEAPKKAKQEKTEEEIVIPFRSEDNTQPAAGNTDEVKVTSHNGFGASVSYDTADSLSFELKPYTYNADIDNGKQNISVSAGPEIGVSGLASQANKSNLNSLPEGGSTCLDAGVGVSFEVSEDVNDNIAFYGETDASVGYKHITPQSQKSSTVSVSNENPRGDAFRYDAALKAGIKYTSLDEKNTVRTYVFGRVNGYAGTLKKGSPQNANLYSRDGKPQYVETDVSNTNLSAGVGVEYTRKTKAGDISFRLDNGIGDKTVRTSGSIDMSSQMGYSLTVGLKYKF